MITKRTCFILGAGASMDFGFPSGIQLWTRICELLPESAKSVPTDQTIEQYYFLSNYGQKAVNFLNELRESGTSSIDAFLGSRHKDYLEIGKEAIAAALIPFEEKETLFGSELKLKGNWYDYLFEQMASPIKEFKENQISFITYNYDRSLEFYLETVLKRRYQATETQLSEIFKSIPIVHLHGSLGRLPWQGEEYTRRYDSEISAENISTASYSIKIIHEVNPSTEEFKIAHQLLSNAETVVFLGFGYDETNLMRLRLHELEPKGYWGTTFRMTTEESNKLGQSFSGCLQYGNMEILPFLRETGVIAKERVPLLSPKRPWSQKKEEMPT